MIVNIEEFCANEKEGRAYLHRPFNNIEGKTVASDGVTIVFMPQDEKYGIADLPITSSIAAMLNEINQAKAGDEFQPLDDLKSENPTKFDCDICEGTGFSENVECEECEGEGKVELHSSFHEYCCDCKGCNGEGYNTIHKNTQKKCKECEGVGYYYKPSAVVRVSDLPFNPFYIDRITRNITNIRVKVISKKMLFIGDGDICGIIMGCTF